MDVRKASKAARHFDSDAPVLRNSVSDFARCAGLDKEPYLEHAVMADETDGVSHFVETAARVGKGQRHDRLTAVSHDAVATGADRHSVRRAASRRLRDNMPWVASDRPRPIIA